MLNSAEAICSEPPGWISEGIVRGVPCGLGLAASNPLEALAFYAEVLGWDRVERPAGDGAAYTALRHEGKQVAILYPAPGAPGAKAVSHWAPFVAVEDVDRSARLADEVGGLLLREPESLQDAGRIARVRDPAGAILSLWQPFEHDPAGFMGAETVICWHELVTPDLDRAAFFYCSLFGWRLTADPRVFTIVRSSYTIANSGIPIGTIREQCEDEQGDAARWIPYFRVESPVRAQRIAEQWGGGVVREASVSPIGHTSVLTDPFGAQFGLLEHPASD
jgi:uncharacterized protein